MPDLCGLFQEGVPDAITATFGISGVQIARNLDSIALFRGYPATIRTDQEPESTCCALDQRAFESGVEFGLIKSGKAGMGGFIESFITGAFTMNV